jgi:arabinose-5-phosphate isomerase
VQESRALISLSQLLSESFSKSIDLILDSCGHIVLTGVGKSSHIAQKIASTFASTGTLSIFIHPTEASHGDLGMVKGGDVLIALSKSGESSELFDLLYYCKNQSIPIVGITANETSSLARISTHAILIPSLPEACSLGLAPTTSTTMMLALGDAMAVVCAEQRKFSRSDFKLFHPGGNLGQSLLKVSDLMHTGEAIPLANQSATLSDAIIEMTRCRFGCVGIVDVSSELKGIFTDGDLRRNLRRVDLNTKIIEVMTINPTRLNSDTFIVEIIDIFKSKRIPSAFVCEDNKVIGILHIHDLLQRGLL